MKRVSAFVAFATLALVGSAHAREMGAHPPAADAPISGEPAVPATAPAAAAVPAVASKLIVGADAAFQRPLGNLGDATGPGFGVLLRGEYNLIPNLNGTLRAGYIYSLKKVFDPGAEGVSQKVSMDNLPIWVGGKYFVTDMIYGAAEVGLNMITGKVETDVFPSSVSTSSTDNKFGATVGVGALVGPLDIKTQLEILDFGHTSGSMAIMVNVGCNFLRS